jgi:CheY-like chemotaxis protein
MPAMDGRRLAEAAAARRPALKVLYTTGYSQNAIIHDGRLDPGVALLVKPFTVDQLSRKLRATLEGGGRRRRSAAD